MLRFMRRESPAFWVSVLRLLALFAAFGACSACSSSGDASKGDQGGAATGGQTSQPVTSTSPNAMEFVAAHNAVRAAVTEPAGYTGTWQALPAVAWSDAVAASAQAWADHLMSTAGCDLQHASGTGYGENLAGGTHVSPQGAVDLWASEKANYTYSPKYAFTNNTGHYTQIVWRASTYIGCASAACAGSNVVVCRY
ncbi:MAG TPA: CAP domain-containing protein, partial [Polyangiaceae bacterium]|nr:CAP domain-containing protein [Polyangiaceae bacterium]